MEEEVIIMFVVISFVAGAVALMVTSMNNRRRLREMQHRERLAMIERGIWPSPEVDPAGFEAATGISVPKSVPSKAPRYRSAGVAMIGLGMALLVLISALGHPPIGIGVGGAWVMLGGALLLNYVLISREAQTQPPPRWTPPPAPVSRGPEPPVNMAP